MLDRHAVLLVLLGAALLPACATPTPALVCGAARRRGQRRAQEDTTLLTSLSDVAPCPPLQLGGVFDGHEGAAAARFAQRELPAALASAIAADDSACDAHAAAWRGDALAAALQRALAAVDTAFCAHAAQHSLPLRDGATAVVALLPADGSLVAVANIGDSRAFVCPAAAASDAPPVVLTLNHAPGVPSEKARIAAAGGFVARGRLQGELAVSRGLGDLPYRRYGLISDADATWRALQPGDALLLVSDGALERATPAQLCGVTAGDAAVQRDVAAAAVSHARSAIALGPAESEASAQPESCAAAPAHTAAGGAAAADVDDDSSGPLAHAAAAAADAALALGSTDNVAVITCAAAPPHPGNRSLTLGAASTAVAVPGALLAGRWRLLGPAAVLRGPYTHDAPAPWTDGAHALPHGGTAVGLWAQARAECAALPGDAPVIDYDADDHSLAPGSGDAACVLALLALPSGGEGHAHSGPVIADAAPLHAAAPEPPPLGGGRFRLGGPAGHGHFGDVWHADSSGATSEDASLRYVLKRAPGGAGSPAAAAAAREAHFGAAMRGAAHAARFVDAFPGVANDTWLVFVDEGVSLDALMYGDAGAAGGASHAAAAASSSLALLAPSAWWHERRATAEGVASLRAIWAGVLGALTEAHGRGVAHRDVKPGNVIVRPRDSPSPTVRLCDWGSAVDAAALRDGLYGPAGPSAAEETPGYAPPEARFSLGADAATSSWPGRNATSALFAYDIWSAGVLGLELLALGTPDVFAPPPRVAAAAARDAAAAGLGAAARDALVQLRGLAALCVTPPPAAGEAQRSSRRALSQQDCSDAAMLAALRQRDPGAAAGGVPLSPWALRLLRRMLAWEPAARPSAARCLQHAFFAAPLPGRGFACADGQPDAEWADECEGGA